MNLSKVMQILFLCSSLAASATMNSAAIAAEVPPLKQMKAEAELALTQMADYQSPKNGFSLKYPKNWEKAEGQDPLICRFLTDNGLVSYRVSVEKLLADMTAEEYAKTVNQELEKQYPLEGSLLTRVEESATKLGSVDAHKSIYKLKLDAEGASAKMLQYLVVANHRAYAFNYTAIEGAYDAFMPVITEVLNSFAFSPVTTDSGTEPKVEAH
ncbi:MAG: hypothetical protein JST89_12650 [Cyanobacteria bacterium SZAS-4]|nr:hypothetical protein [Cyanobacteria bacterium SZAS-4]